MGFAQVAKTTISQAKKSAISAKPRILAIARLLASGAVRASVGTMDKSKKKAKVESPSRIDLPPTVATPVSACILRFCALLSSLGPQQYDLTNLVRWSVS